VRAEAAVVERLVGGGPGSRPAADLAGRWHAARRQGARLTVVVGAASEEMATELLDEVAGETHDG
jgi:nucleoid-associated protein YgaU